MEKPWLEQSSDEKLKYIADNAEDCEFLVGMKDVEEPKSIKFFKEILSSISPVFERMFNGDFKEAKSSDPVLIDDFYFKGFEQFLAFVKNQDAYVTKWKSLYCIAKKYMADELIKSIMACLDIRVNPYTSLVLFEISHLESTGWHDRQYFISNVYITRVDLIVKAIETPLIYRLAPSAFLSLVKILTNRRDKISQVKLFIAIDRYCDRESNFSSISKKSYFQSMYLKELSFSGLTADEFRDFVEPSDLLDPQTKLKIVLKIGK